MEKGARPPCPSQAASQASQEKKPYYERIWRLDCAISGSTRPLVEAEKPPSSGRSPSLPYKGRVGCDSLHHSSTSLVAAVVPSTGTDAVRSCSWIVYLLAVCYGRYGCTHGMGTAPQHPNKHEGPLNQLSRNSPLRLESARPPHLGNGTSPLGTFAVRQRNASALGSASSKSRWLWASSTGSGRPGCMNSHTVLDGN